MKWTYIVLPMGIARFASGELQIRRVDNDLWVDVSGDAQAWHMIEQDGYSVPEERALEVHERFKKELAK